MTNKDFSDEWFSIYLICAKIQRYNDYRGFQSWVIF